MIKTIITDVEGTTTSISFVHNTLFPFAKERLKAYCLEHMNDLFVHEALALTKETILKEKQKNASTEEAIDQLLTWIKEDRKHPALKAIQGHIWEEGYKSGEIKGHIYNDVPEALESWKNQGITLGVYSSGSVKAQHLIFEFSNQGNLRPYFSAYFDTKIGHKREVQSYKNIILELGVKASEVLFLSDIKEELDAARSAGLQTIQLVRQDDVILGDHKTVRDFKEIKL